MSDESPQRDYRTARERLAERHEDGVVTDDDFNRITDFLDAYDPNSYRLNPPNGDSTKEYATLKSYCSRYTWVSHRMQGETLVTATTDDINRHMGELRTGDNPHIKDDGFSKSTISLYQAALRTFYNYHDDLNIEPEDITITQPDDPSIDPEDLFDESDVYAMREATSNPRDRCLIELLLQTGQRIRAIQTLRLKDVNPEEGTYRLNPGVGGLKHAEGKRSLFGARSYVRDWMWEYHPTSDPEDYLITGLHNNNNGSEAGDMLSKTQIRRRLRKIANDAGIEKDVNPHQWRHYAVTVMYRDYNVGLDDIRWNIGHGEGSRILETTYRHLTDEDRIKDMEEAAGFRETEEETSPMTPDICGNCGTRIVENARFCQQCGEGYDPNMDTTKEDVRDSIYNGKGDTENETQDEAMDALKRVADENPEKLVEFVEKL